MAARNWAGTKTEQSHNGNDNAHGGRKAYRCSTNYTDQVIRTRARDLIALP